METAEKLRSKSIREIKLIGNDKEEYVFKLRGISGQLVIDNYDLFAGMDRETVEVDTENLTKDDVSFVKEKVAPLLRLVLPKCCIEPAIAEDAKDERLHTDPPTAIEVDDLPPEMLMQLFEKVLELAGMSKKIEEKRKKLPSQTTPNS